MFTWNLSSLTVFATVLVSVKTAGGHLSDLVILAIGYEEIPFWLFEQLWNNPKLAEKISSEATAEELIEVHDVVDHLRNMVREPDFVHTEA